MTFEEDRQAATIAAEWGVTVDLLEATVWEIEPINGNDGEIYGYRVRFDDETDPELLTQLGLRPGEVTRELSINAFDQPDNDQDDYISPDLAPGKAYLTTENDSKLTDEHGRGLIVDNPSSPVPAQPNGSDSAALRNEMLDRLNILEGLIRQQMQFAPNRGHNNPPELLEIERPVSQEQLAEVTSVIAEIRKGSESASPNRDSIEAHVSMFRKVAQKFKIGTILFAGTAATGIIEQEAALAFTEHKQQLYEALIQASDAVTAWLQSLPPPS